MKMIHLHDFTTTTRKKNSIAKTLLTVFWAIMPLFCDAADFEVDGICYDITSSNECSVARKESGYYTGEISIPASVTYDGTTYSVTGIGERAFHYSGLRAITIPNSVTSIGECAFRYCGSLTDVVIPNSVTSIGKEAFFFCDGLTSITIPNSVMSVGERAFKYCHSLVDVTISNSVTSIADGTFENCTRLANVTIPSNVKSIGESAFGTCSRLTSVAIPNSVTCIGKKAFFGCFELSEITIPSSVIDIGCAPFINCGKLMITVSPENPAYASLDGVLFNKSFTSLICFARGGTEYSIPDGVTNIEDSAFYNCTGLNDITIPCSVTTIGKGAFLYCSGLTDITIPNGVTNIGKYAFEQCSGLTDITISGSVTSIEERAFCGCTGLTSITIPNSVTSIGKEVFFYCLELSDVTNLATIPQVIGDDCFSLYVEYLENGEVVYTPNTSLTLHVLPRYEDVYREAEGWKNFNIVGDAKATAVESVRFDVETAPERIYDLGGKPAKSLQRGINIVKMSDGTTHKVIGR